MLRSAEKQSDYHSVYRAYLKLPSESYEFVSRTMAMHGWLRQAYDEFLHYPGLEAGDLYAEWQEAFQHVYENLFAMFLQPYRLLMTPLDYLRQSSQEAPSGTLANAFIDGMRLWGETENRFLKATAEALHALSGDGGKAAESRDRDITSQLAELSPANILLKVADEGTRAYFETLGQFSQWLGQNQYILPKGLFLSVQAVAESYPRVVELGRKYEAMYRDAWEKSLRMFALAMSRRQKPIEFKDFFKAYLDTFAQEYGKLMVTPEFMQAQSQFVNATADTIIALRKLMDHQMEMAPFLPVTTRSETDALESRVHSYKKRSDALERRVRELEQKVDSLTSAVPHRVAAGNARRSVKVEGQERAGRKAVAARRGNNGKDR